MEENANLLSLRIFTADHYMTAPLAGLDSSYSEFRSEPIRQVPIIRIFGTDLHGTKTCAHVHGVFPYLYIPYHGTIADAGKFLYQVAISLDKAINISLGQASSSTQHVFKVVLVKGIPFYGYHPNEHQFLKIYLYNPLFVRKASTLLQNGAILGKIHQPHETHLPFVQQFMIDYNLYGMSFVHIPAEVVRFRADSLSGRMQGIRTGSTLDPTIERQSVSRVELDVPSSYIMNRYQLDDNASKQHANPGIAFLWRDERIRRSRLTDAPDIDPPDSQVRGQVSPSESDSFHRTALVEKLKHLEAVDASGLNETQLDVTASDNQPIDGRTFNLSKLLTNSVYPVECSKETSQSILNASYVEQHLSKPSAFRRSFSDRYADESIVDAALVLSLSQSMTSNLNQTLNEDEYALLAVMEDLDTDVIDENSILAPLSQRVDASPIDTKQSYSEMKLVDKSISMTCVGNGTKTEECNGNEELFDDSDDDLLNNFSMNFDPGEMVQLDDSFSALNVKHLPSLPQFDGGHDKSPSKVPMKRMRKNTPCVYPPLNVTVTKSPVKHMNIMDILKNKSEITVTAVASKKRKLPSDPPSPIVIDLTDETDDLLEVASSPAISAKPISDKIRKKSVVKIKKMTPETDNDPLSDVIAASPTNIGNERRYNLRQRCQIDRSTSKYGKPAAVPSCELNASDYSNTSIPLELQSNWSTCEVAREYDKRMNFYPEPGPSNGNYYEHVDIPSYHWQPPCVTTPRIGPSTSDNLDTTESDDATSATMLLAQSFYEQSGIFNSPKPSSSSQQSQIGIAVPAESSAVSDAFLYELPLQVIIQMEKNFSSVADVATSPEHLVVITTEKLPPTCKQVADDMHTYNIPKCIHPTPYYSNSADITRRKECGTTILQIGGDRLSDLDEFRSEVIDTDAGLYAWRRRQYELLTEEPSLTSLVTTNHVREVLAGEKRNTISLYRKAPTVDDARKWLKTKRGTDMKRVNGMKTVNGHTSNCRNDFDSPIKVRQETVKFRLNTGDELASSDDDCSIIMSPMMPATSTAERTKVISESSLLKPAQVDQAKAQPSNGKQLYLENVKNSNLTPSDSPTTLTAGHGERPKVIRTSMLMAADRSTAAQTFKPQSSNAKQCLKLNFENVKKSNRTRSECDSPNLFDDSATVNADVVVNGVRCDDEICVDYDDDDLICLDDVNSNANSVDSSAFAARVNKNSRRETNGMTNGVYDVSRKPKIVPSIAATPLTLPISPFTNQFALDETNYSSGEHSFGITGVTLENTFGFKMDLENYQSVKANLEHNYLTIMSLECHVQTRGNLRPDPDHDAVACIFYVIENDVPDDDARPCSFVGAIIVDGQSNTAYENPHHRLLFETIADKCHVKRVQNENELFLHILRIVSEWDPDIFAGYEIEMASWGYIIQRGYVIDFNLPVLLSRVTMSKFQQQKNPLAAAVDADRSSRHDDYGDFEPGIRLAGRVLLDVWRILRSEIALSSYTFENVMYHIMHRRYAVHSHKHLSRMWTQSTMRSVAVEYYLQRVHGTLILLNQLDLIGRTCELAKLFGIQFYEVLSRGSQFRVESMMLRIAKPRNIIPVSPSVQQRAHMRAPEYLPLILEPRSRMYTDPIIVLDFQSLYPSMIIAYNYCFSTCLGRVEHLGQSQPFEFGASQLRVSPTHLRKLLDQNLVTVSPCGAVFVKANVREGVLPRMLREILDTRLMVKQSMKLHKSDKVLQRILHSRQLGLKLMANVTYGYTAANFSGRMPCVEVGDSVVSKGRETLERAIRMVEDNKVWRSKVVYGDTDSLFVMVPGRSRDEAFRIGAEIAAAVTDANPQPVKLKLEKVYQPSILQTKKRYVGYMYETAEQMEPVYEAKGIETVRRDGCPAVAKMLEKTLKILFDTCDVSAVKRYVCRQFTKIMSGRASIQDLIYAKEFRGLSGYKPGACVPALELTKKSMQSDRRAEPRKGERVPYVIVNGPPGVPLIRLVRSPHEYLDDEGLRINSVYYITKAIVPPLNRCLLLIGADASQWYADLPKRIHATVAYKPMPLGASLAKKSTISQYFASTACVADCGAQTKSGLCSDCLKRPHQSAIVLASKIGNLERKYSLVQSLCQSCCGRAHDVECKSLDCPVLFVQNKWKRDARQITCLRNLLKEKCAFVS